MDNEPQDEMPSLNSDKKEEKKEWHTPYLRLIDIQTTKGGAACLFEGCLGVICS